MSKVIACPKCGGPLDVPAYPGDGVYRTHWCPKATDPMPPRELDWNLAEAPEW